MERFLILHPGALGDILLAIPFLLGLHKRKIVISFYTQSWLTELHNIFKFIDEWRSLESGNIYKLFGSNFNPEELPSLSDFSKIIAFFRQENDLKKNLIKLRLPFICESFIPPRHFKKHISEHLSDIFGFTPRTEFIRNKANAQKNGTIIIHPGSGNVLKNWGIENYIKLADELKNIGEKVLFLLGPAEIQMLDLLKDGEKTFFFSERLTDIYKLLRSAKLYIGNDSGITHLSAISGTRTVAIFGPSDPFVWRPQGRNVYIVTKRSDTFQENLDYLPSCFPCILRDKIIKCNENKLCMPSYEEVSTVIRMILS